MGDHVRLFEVSPRDGLQNEKLMISAADKILLVDMLSGCGFEKIEVTSFVSPKWVPQMADAAEVMAGIKRESGIDYAVLTPNMKGYDAAKKARADEVAVFTAATEGFARANTNGSIADTIERFMPISEAAARDGIKVRGYISCVTDCPYDGAVDPAVVANLAETLINAGCYEVSLGDTIGKANPETTSAMLDAVLDVVSADKLAGHFHDTSGRALENITVSLERGLRVFDASVGGLGGCPYAPGASGNVATGPVVELLHASGYETGINIEKLSAAGAFAVGLRSCG